MVEPKGRVLAGCGKRRDSVVHPEAEFFYKHDACWVGDEQQDEDEPSHFQQRSRILDDQNGVTSLYGVAHASDIVASQLGTRISRRYYDRPRELGVG